ncbi:MAG: hypothetical protein M0036_24505 [Desulfobacteraceae bacterium]|nr:hypothetical protein [Desulfobacteraceae bacterium]
MKKKLSLGLYALGLLFYLVLPCFGMGTAPPSNSPTFTNTLLAKAEVDECYNGIGQPYKAGPTCASNEKKKANQSYLWGMTKSGDTIWFGTAPNMLCLVQAFSEYENPSDYTANPYQGSLWVCEYAKGQYLKTKMPNVPAPAVFNDYRPPKIYTYNITTKTLTDKTLAITDANAQLLLQATFGLRSAVTYSGLVILSGPMALGAGINVFVFNASTGNFIAAGTLTSYQNIRKWLVLNNVLYTAVGKESGGGAVLRWSGTMANPLAFTEVGTLDGTGAELEVYNGRIFVSTWPSRTGTANLAGLWMSPVVSSTGLTTADAASWKKVWQVDKYEPDAFGAMLYGMGAMASYGGYLYWGTMHVQGKAALSYIKQYNIPTYGYADAYFNSWRATAVFRGSNFDTTPSVELLYGESSMPVFVKSGSSGYWTTSRNKMGGVSGRYGTSGFGNDYNNYTWTMAVYKNQLFVGTMDFSYLILDWNNLQNEYTGGNYIPIPWFFYPDSSEFGADLWRFPSASSAAVRVSRDGLGNYTNYGFRNSIADDATGLYLGTANPANIAANSDGSLKGGWELRRLVQN